MTGAADIAGFVCPACGNAISYRSVLTRLLGSEYGAPSVYALLTPYCQCVGFPGQEMILQQPTPREPDQPAPGQ